MTTRYGVNTIYPSIQGEGAKTGTPMVILRLQGCDVGCPWCDTKETWEKSRDTQLASLEAAIDGNHAKTGPYWAEAGAREIADYIASAFPQIHWVLLTGGEPGLYDLGELTLELSLAGFRIAVETSGTAAGVLAPGADWLTVSPKIGMPGKKVVLPEVVRIADEIKWVVGKPSDIDRLIAFLDSHVRKPRCTISLQPLSESKKATQLCVEACLRNGWSLSVQVHKVVGLA